MSEKEEKLVELQSLKPGTMVHISHFGNAKFLRINGDRIAVVERDGKEITIERVAKVTPL